jgi:ABC-type bacteriocin/lantibiotic exporter with double-glycine peptidase domain
MLMAITKNLASQHTCKRRSSNILLGGLSIRDVPRAEWLEHFGLIMEENFFFIGTIKENISWKLPNYNHEQAR